MALIIIADDDPVVSDVVRCTRSSHGYLVGVVANGLDALQAVEAKQPDLVILDCSMPGLSAGAEEYLRKRFDPAEMLVMVERMPAKSETRRTAAVKT